MQNSSLCPGLECSLGPAIPLSDFPTSVQKHLVSLCPGPGKATRLGVGGEKTRLIEIGSDSETGWVGGGPSAVCIGLLLGPAGSVCGPCGLVQMALERLGDLIPPIFPGVWSHQRKDTVMHISLKGHFSPFSVKTLDMRLSRR